MSDSIRGPVGPERHPVARKPVGRRALLGLGLTAAAGIAWPQIGWGKAIRNGERLLSFHHLHTGENLRVAYWRDGTYESEALAEINRHLRDFRTGESNSISPKLLDFLHALRTEAGSSDPFHVISGYRSPKTNAMLRKKSSGVAKKSLHMRGMAVDVSLPGRDLRQLRDAAKRLERGGVGYYAKSGFIHLDVGAVRSW